MIMSLPWKKALIYTGVTVGGGLLAVVIIGIAAPLVGVLVGGALGFSGAAAVGSTGLTARSKPDKGSWFK
jgi:hypothetical protein